MRLIMLAGLACGAVAIFAPEQGSSLLPRRARRCLWDRARDHSQSARLSSALMRDSAFAAWGLSRAGHTVNFGFRPIFLKNSDFLIDHDLRGH